MIKIMQIVAEFTNGLKISSQSIPGCWLRPLATRRALCGDNDPDVLSFFLNNEIQLTMLAAWSWDKYPSFVRDKCSIFVYHCIKQVGILKSM